MVGFLSFGWGRSWSLRAEQEFAGEASGFLRVSEGLGLPSPVQASVLA